MTYIITVENFYEAEEAIRDILFMYRDLIRSYEGFGHNIEVGKFDPFTFVDADLYEKPGYSVAMDMNLIHQGSAVTILCYMSDLWDEEQGDNIPKTEYGRKIVKALNAGRLNHLPLAEAAVIVGLESEDNLRELLPQVYSEYVIGYFQRLLGGRN